ncbi:MAG: hypothetical protein F6K18_30910 [Okeania sp. SIO2C2]|uniref:hypothetical protein n=1 Tax=Okeania sp. SIO2C2 TaxID=2607787 RepID=UPI0013B935EB|nr:hypothetical protein [Okeania sp. SIO2C2]NEP90865.1 hypothetical protein [Okeania sp. SIO2C2]
MTIFSVSYTKKNLSLLLSSFLILVGTIFIVPYGSFQEAGIVIKFWIGISIMSLGFIISWAIPSINLAWFWSITILTRLILILMEPGDDIWRYLWEGYIQNLGFSPYDLAPNALELIPYRTEWWSLMNHPDTSAIYPPLIQLGFRFLALISPSVFVFKFAFILADLGICWLLSRKFSLQKTLIYAWNPLILYSFAGGGHYDSWFILPLVGAWLVFVEEGRGKKEEGRGKREEGRGKEQSWKKWMGTQTPVEEGRGKEEEGRRKDRSWKKWMGTQTPVKEGRGKKEEGRRKDGSWKKWMGTQTPVKEGRGKKEEGRRKDGSWKKWMGTQTLINCQHPVDGGVLNSKEQDNYRWYWSAFLIGISVAIKWVSLPILSFVVWQKILCFREQGTGNREQKIIKINMLHSAEKPDKQDDNFHSNLQLDEVHKTRFSRFKLDNNTLSYLLYQVQQAGFLLLIGLLPMCVAALNFCEPGKCSLIPTSSNFVVNGRSAELIPYLVSFVSEQSTKFNWIYGIPLCLGVGILIWNCHKFVYFAEWYFFLLLTLSPIVHAWYFAWFIPFAVATRNLGIRWVSLSGFIYFVLPYRQTLGDNNWLLTPMERYWLWLPLIVGFIWSKWKDKKI